MQIYKGDNLVYEKEIPFTFKYIGTNNNKIVGIINNNENFQKAMDENQDISSLKFCKNYFTMKNNQKYRVLRYDKNYLSNDVIASHGLFRSVIVNQEKKVVSFAPPKSYSIESFQLKYPNKTDDIIAQEFVEGTMINVLVSVFVLPTNLFKIGRTKAPVFPVPVWAQAIKSLLSNIKGIACA